MDSELTTKPANSVEPTAARACEPKESLHRVGIVTLRAILPLSDYSAVSLCPPSSPHGPVDSDERTPPYVLRDYAVGLLDCWTCCVCVCACDPVKSLFTCQPNCKDQGERIMHATK